MRIDLNSNLQPADEPQPAKPGGRAGETAANSQTSGDLPGVSAGSLSVSALAVSVSQLPEVRQERVGALAEQVRSGTYNISPKQTAEAMILQMRVSQAPSG
jgi:negative regulator of flagellin synthesis FlgM